MPISRMATMLHAGLIRLAHIDAPVIMAVNGGRAVGSPWCCQVTTRLHRESKIISAYTASGLTPDGSSTYFLAKHVGLLRQKSTR